MSEQLCIFCERFQYGPKTYSCGSTMTGPWTSGGGASCSAGHFAYEYPESESEYRALILRGRNCGDYCGLAAIDAS